MIASSSEIGAVNDTPKEAASTDARNTSLQTRARRRQVRVGNADAIRAVSASLLRAFDRLPQAAPEADGHDHIPLVHHTRYVRHAASGGHRDDRQSQDRELIFQVFRQNRRAVGGKNDDAPSRCKNASQSAPGAWRPGCSSAHANS